MNPLIVEAWRGMATPGRAQRIYLGYLALQMIAAVVWWPKIDLAQALRTHDGPDPLLAVSITMGITLAYYALRAGAEEILFDGQYPLREWVASGLSLPRLILGYLGRQFLQSLHAVALSAPLLLACMAVTASTVLAVVACMTAAIVHALFFRLVGTCVYLRLGHYRPETFILIRVIFFVAYFLVFYAFAPASQIALAYHFFRYAPLASDVGISPLAVFCGLYVIASATLVGVLYHQLMRYRESLTE